MAKVTPGQDHQPAHGRGALLLEQVTLGAVSADRLAFALADAQRPDDDRAEQEDEQQSAVINAPPVRNVM